MARWPNKAPSQANRCSRQWSSPSWPPLAGRSLATGLIHGRPSKTIEEKCINKFVTTPCILAYSCPSPSPHWARRRKPISKKVLHGIGKQIFHYLTVRVGVGAAHCRSLVFKDLNPPKMGTLSCFKCMLYINLFYLRRSLWYQLNQNKQVFKADSTCTSRSSYLYLWHRLVNLFVLVLAQVGQQRNFTCTCWSTHLYFWPKLVISPTQVSITALISFWLINGNVTFDFGLKHITLQVPRAAADLKGHYDSVHGWV